MNRRVLNGVLTVSLIIIWSIAGYRFLGTKELKNQESEIPVFIQDETSMVEKKHPFHFTLAKRDPFLDVFFSTKSSKPLASKKPSNIKKHNTSWPDINFYGFVKNENNENALVLIKLGGEMRRVREGDTHENFIIHTIYKDSIIVKKGNEYRTFLRQ